MVATLLPHRTLHTLFSLQNPQTHLKSTRHQLIFNATFVRATGNFKIPTVAPRRGPTVLHQPIISGVFRAVPNDFDRVATQLSTGLVAVHTTFVMHEIRVDGKGTFHGAIGGQFRHQLRRVDVVHVGQFVFVAVPITAVRAFFGAFGGGDELAFGQAGLGRGVTRGDWTTLRFQIRETFLRDQPGLLGVVPRPA